MSGYGPNYRPGIGMPAYLLDRNDNDSGIFSQDASTIINSSLSTTPLNDTYSLTSVSSFNVTSVSSWSMNTEISAVSTSFASCTSENQSTRIDISSSVPTVKTTTGNSFPGISFLTGAIGVGSGSTQQNNQSSSDSTYYNLLPPHYRDPANMFTPYVPLLNNDEEVPHRRQSSPEMMDIDVREGEKVTSSPEPPSIPIRYDQCCLSDQPSISRCGESTRHYAGWTPRCITFANLAHRDVRPYLKRICVIKKTEEDSNKINEKNLIANRLLLKNILIDDSMSICPRHRGSFGIDWLDYKSVCHYPDPDPKHQASTSDCRRANLAMCSRIEGFPIGGRLCSKHRKMMSVRADVVSNSEQSQYTNTTPYVVEDTRETMNRILAEASLSPVRSQVRTTLQNQSKSSLRRLLSKLTRGARTLQEKLAETLAPGQAEELLQMARLTTDAQDYADANETMENEIVQNLKEIYQLYVDQKMPFVEQVRILSLLPRSWNYEKIMEIFGCTRHAIKTAHRMQDENQYMLRSEMEPHIRQRADPNKIKHFVNWLVESDTLVSGTYGLTTLRMDSGEKFELSKQILQSRKTHAIANYKKYCEETDFESLGNRKLFDILSGLKPSQQRALAGIDEFVVEGIEAWSSLSGIVNAMSIPQVDRKRLLKQIDMAEQYQKVAHISHCSDNSDCITHCDTFGLSDPKCPQHQSKCTRPHTTDCPDCINIIVTLDEIGERITKIVNEEIKRETTHDFDNASQHIIEWSRHNLRANRQSDAKNIVLSQMGDDEAFCTFDWGQKILPQEFRESQSAYFGKKGMSILVGSFVWKKSPTSGANATTTSAPIFNTESYILALTSAAQTDLDTLSAGEIITKQFMDDQKHIRKLHKRTDNAGNFSSHATPEVEKLICDRMGIQLLTRDYSEVQKGKDICDRVCGVAKARMRSWVSNGNDLLNANDIKEGMEYAGGVKNTKLAVAEIIPDTGYLGKTNVPNISTIRSVVYSSTQMKVFRASNIGDGTSIPYKKIGFETNMRLISPFTDPITDEQFTLSSKKRSDREHHEFLMCPVSGCTSTFEASTDLDSHIAANQHQIPPSVPRTSNDIARLHLIETLRSTNIQSQQDTTRARVTHNTTSNAVFESTHYQHFSTPGWALRTRKHTITMSEKTKTFIDELWTNSQKTRSKVTPEQVLQQTRNQRDNNSGNKLFQPSEYPTINQIKYRFRKLGVKHGVTAKQELIAELIEANVE